MQNYPSQQSAEITIDLAKALISTLQERVLCWRQAYIRFEASEHHYGSKGSYVTDSGILLFDPFQFKELFGKINSLGLDLREDLTNKGDKFCLFLLSVNSDFDFHIEYEWHDPTRWQITKMDGRSGLPEGLTNNSFKPR